MLDIDATYQDGVFVPERPVNLPNGTKARVHPAEPPTEAVADVPFVMMREEDWPTTPEGIAALLARWKTLEPLEFTPEEEAEIAAWRAEVKRYNVEAVRKQMGLGE